MEFVENKPFSCTIEPIVLKLIHLETFPFITIQHLFPITGEEILSMTFQISTLTIASCQLVNVLRFMIFLRESLCGISSFSSSVGVVEQDVEDIENMTLLLKYAYIPE